MDKFEKAHWTQSQVPRFGTRELLRLTAWAAAILAIVRWLGPNMTWVLFLIAYAFAPSIALAICLSLRQQPKFVRYGIAAIILAAFVATMMITCAVIYDAEAAVLALLGTIIEWPGQAAILMCLFLIQQGSGVEQSKLTEP